MTPGNLDVMNFAGHAMANDWPNPNSSSVYGRRCRGCCSLARTSRQPGRDPDDF